MTYMPFEHYCHCGKWGSFGYGVCLMKNKPGTWYCFEHRPAPTPPQPATTPRPTAPIQGQLSLFEEERP